MATVISSDLNATTGWTEVDVGAGTITPTNAGGRDFIRIVGTATTDQTGIVFDTTFTGARDQVIYWDYQSDGTANCIMGLTESAAITEAGIIGIAIDGTNFKMWDGSGYVGSKAATAAWWNLLLIISGDGDIQGYCHADDGTAHSEITSWTYIGNIGSATNFDPLAATLYFAVNAETADNNDVDTLVVTDNGFTGDTLADCGYLFSTN